MCDSHVQNADFIAEPCLLNKFKLNYLLLKSFAPHETESNKPKKVGTSLVFVTAYNRNRKKKCVSIPRVKQEK